ncbi:MAG: DUF6586 family protein [Oleiphilaceae bacterium]|nr:DUF6586 family protein [Oleiphilaceae bacterium]
MSKSQSQVRAQLYVAEKLLDQRSLTGAHVASLEYAAKLCLKEAWTKWMHELYQLLSPQKEASVVNDWDAFVALLGEEHPEVQRLINLKSTPDSWLSVLLREIESLNFGAAPVTTPADENTGNMIPLRQLEQTPETSDLLSILGGFKAYVAEVQAYLLEW